MDYGLSHRALQALNQLDLGRAFKLDELLLDDVLQMIEGEGAADDGERLLAAEIRTMPTTARESISRAISAGFKLSRARAGSSKSKAKAAAARENGRSGGRPKKVANRPVDQK
ncbi:MAG: hypothetical protein KGL39_14100 [Patescibacteria group bacterium]|nr:hypothetical protein [Patescibacteria group bacterium]